MSSPRAPQTGPSTDRIPLLDMMRGAAALSVFLYHLWNQLYPGQNTQAHPAQLSAGESWHFYLTFFLFQFGYFGVTIFFVVSGFCIHLPQARRRVRTGSDGLQLKPFFLRRFWRLYPAYFFGLLVACLCFGAMVSTDFCFQPGTAEALTWTNHFAVDQAAVSALFLQPFFPSASVLNGPLWTLVVEVHFYLCYPLLLLLTRRWGIGRIAALLLACEIGLTYVPSLKHVFFLSRYFEWYLGFIAAERVAQRGFILDRASARIWCITAALAGVLATFIPWLWPHANLIMAAATVLALAWLMDPQEQVGTIGRQFGRLLSWLGLFSYSLYLLHLPLMRLCYAGNRFLADWLNLPESYLPWLLLDSIPVVIAVAFGFYWLFERPFLKSSHQVVAKPPSALPITNEPAEIVPVGHHFPTVAVREVVKV